MQNLRYKLLFIACALFTGVQTLLGVNASEHYTYYTRQFLGNLGVRNPATVPVRRISVNDPLYNNAAGYSDGTAIHLNEDTFANHSEGNNLFTCAHEAAHHALRHAFQVHRDTLVIEQEADVTAARMLCTHGYRWVVEEKVDLLRRLVRAGQGGHTDGLHPTTQEEYEYLRRVLETNGGQNIGGERVPGRDQNADRAGRERNNPGRGQNVGRGGAGRNAGPANPGHRNGPGAAGNNAGRDRNNNAGRGRNGTGAAGNAGAARNPGRDQNAGRAGAGRNAGPANPGRERNPGPERNNAGRGRNGTGAAGNAGPERNNAGRDQNADRAGRERNPGRDQNADRDYDNNPEVPERTYGTAGTEIRDLLNQFNDLSRAQKMVIAGVLVMGFMCR